MKEQSIHTDNDDLLLQQLHEGKKEAFDTLYQKYWKFVINLSFKRINNIEKSEDIAQEIFIQLWLRRNDMLIKSLPAYLFIAVRNNVFSLMAKENKYIAMDLSVLTTAANDDATDELLLSKEALKRYEEEVNALPSQQKIILKMRYDDELSTDQVSQLLDLSPKTVRNHLGRALSTIRTALMLCLSFLYIDVPSLFK